MSSHQNDCFADVLTSYGCLNTTHLENIMAEIPVLDFSAYNVFKGGEFDESNVEIQKLSQEILDAFTMVGFVYIRNHGIPQAEVCIFGC